MITYNSLEEAARANNCRVNDLVFDREEKGYTTYYIQIGWFMKLINIAK